MDDYDIIPNVYSCAGSIPSERVIGKLDEYLDRNDIPGAERHLKYWISEAEACGDMRGKLTVLNEQIGLYRRSDREEACLSCIREALPLTDTLGLGESVSGATTLINAATGCCAFGRAEEAVPLYRSARDLYEALLSPSDGRLGGLYNNMALALTAVGSYREAEALYKRALGIMEANGNGELSQAITYLNLADMVAAEEGAAAGEKRIEEYLLEAERLLDAENLPRDGYYAFVCGKCAPVFGYYGYFITAEELERRAKEIYERT